jgi:solute carrier family 25 carnitine/acylcarnitine transporter 20/29
MSYDLMLITIHRFYPGLAAPLTTITIVRLFSMSIYQESKYKYSDWIRERTGFDPLVSANTRGEYPGLLTMGCFGAAGATAGFLVTAVACK